MTVTVRDIGRLDPVDPPAIVRSDVEELPGAGIYRHRMKKFVDLVLVLLFLPVALPLIAAMALATACDGAPPFFTQPRVGLGGKVFRLVKIRTMVPDAEAPARGASCRLAGGTSRMERDAEAEGRSAYHAGRETSEKDIAR